VYTPAGYTPAGRYAGIAVAHPNGGVKEQVAGLFAQHLAELGYVAITADASFQGGSAGQPRQTDKPANRIEDVRGMADFLTSFPGVDADRIGLLGICGGGGYSLAAAQTDKRFIAVATISMFNSGLVRRNGLQDSQLATVAARLQQAADARRQEALGGLVQYQADGIPTPEQVAALPKGSLYREGIEYYGDTHNHPRSSARYTTASLIDLAAFDATDRMDLIDQPLLMIAGSNADTKYMTDDAFAKATRTNDKSLYVIDGASHIQTYWVPEYVAEALEQLKGFFHTQLS
jgi:fermentation-respiration switch protein FrsA (DUF1100 family)